MNKSLRLLNISTVVSIGGFAGVQPLAVTVMEQQGLGAASIGLLSALIFGGILLLAPFQPALALRFGSMRTYQTGKILALLGFTGCGMATAPWIWAVSLFVLGLAAALTWPLTESLIATEAPTDQKGASLGRFHAALGVAFAVGPLLAAVLASWPRGVFFGAAGIAGLSSLPLLGTELPALAAEPEDETALATVWRSSGSLAILAFLGGLFENGTHTAGTLVALNQGWSKSAAVALAGVMAAGSYVVQRPLGDAADVRGGRGMLRWALAVLAIGLMALPFVACWSWLLWALAMVWGGASGCLYTLAITSTAQECASRHVVAATTLIVLGYTVGSALGPVLAGLAVHVSPLAGVAWVFGPLAVLGWLVAMRHRPAP